MLIEVVSLELAKNGVIDLKCETSKIHGPEIASELFIDQIGTKNVEYLGLICLDIADTVINYSIINIGKSSEINVDPAQIFRVVLLSNASKFIIAHNHPSGIAKPSNQDIILTKKIGYIAQLMGIELMDSLIVTKDKSFSIRSHVKGGNYHEE